MTSVAATSRRRRAPKAPPQTPAQRRADIVSRTLAGLFGAYGFAAVSAGFMALYLPMPKPEATTAGMMLSVVVWVCAGLWVFAARTATRAWIGLAAPTAVMGLLIILAGGRT